MSFNMPMMGNVPQPGQATFDGKPDSVVPEFFRASKHMPHQSEVEKRPVFVGIDRVKISQTGEMDNTIEDVNEWHKQRWPRQWEQYQAGQAQMIAGTPLIELFPGNPEVVAQLKTVNVHTVEGLIKVPDSAQHAVPFLAEWKNRAQQYVERTQKSATITEIEQRFEVEHAEKIALQGRLAALEAKFAEMPKGAKQKEAA